MKRITLYIITTVMCMMSYAQTPKWYKKISQIQVTVYTWDAKGTMHEAPGVYLDTKGRVATEYDVMKGAVRASVTDTKGKEWKVVSIDGASSLYNICTLQTDNKKSVCVPLASSAPAKGDVVFPLQDVKAGVKKDAARDTVSDVQKFDEVYNYSTLTHTPDERQIGCPVLNANGQLLGFVQAASKENMPGYILDAHYAESKRVTAMDATRSDYRAIGIRKSLPQDEKDALTFLYLTGKEDTTAYLETVDEYINRYQTSGAAYVIKAEMLASAARFADAEKTLTDGQKVSGIAKDELLYCLAKLMYQTSVRQPNPYSEWTLDKSLENVREAFGTNPLPLYTSLEANILYAKKDYAGAEEKFLALTKTNMRSAENFISAAHCREIKGDSIQAVIELQDSALSVFSRPYPQEAAPIMLMRAISNTKAGRKRQAISDYNEYEHLAGSASLTYLFYYEREQLEAQCRMFAPALNDIERAIKLEPNEPILYAEMASLNYRVGQNDEAETAARKAVELDEKFSDAWRVLGVVLRAKGKEADAKQALQKAIDLGDETAKKLL